MKMPVKKKPFTWSPTAMKVFKTCQLKWWGTWGTPSPPPYEETPATIYGNKVHSALEIEYLQQQSDAGFFLMAEGSQIDWGGHANDLDYAVAELMDFDAAVGHAMDFAERDGNTLVLITADHETGGLTLPTAGAESEDPYSDAGHHFSTIGHTSAMVPVYAFGKGAEHFSGIYENNAIYAKLLLALGR